MDIVYAHRLTIPFMALILSVTSSVLVCWPLGHAQAPADQKHPWQIADPVVSAVNRGVGLMEQYDYVEAVKAFEQAVDLVPKLIEARLNLAIALYNRCAKGDVEKASKLLK